MRQGQRQGAADERRAVLDHERAELRQKPVGARDLAGRIYEPAERRGELHGSIMGLTRRSCHLLFPTPRCCGRRLRGGNEETSMTEALMVRRETHVAAPAATVFAFLTDPEKILSWIGAEATTEAHPGGLYLVKGIGGDPARAARGALREVVPVHRLPSHLGWGG